ncbi:hypothetical protein GDO78_004972 [Eleutherodactylus coqui]|uniref:Uncharacterized protein n=1 Tax=Eleutherodactylus coqui TaxID=57060 RepID=A0A8J6FIK7_ELECQ|nr:hypothetical protein GDO78_004972 [Eleutherodactylus coqui]
MSIVQQRQTFLAAIITFGASIMTEGNRLSLVRVCPDYRPLLPPFLFFLHSPETLPLTFMVEQHSSNLTISFHTFTKTSLSLLGQVKERSSLPNKSSIVLPGGFEPKDFLRSENFLPRGTFMFGLLCTEMLTLNTVLFGCCLYKN